MFEMHTGIYFMKARVRGIYSDDSIHLVWSENNVYQFIVCLNRKLTEVEKSKQQQEMQFFSLDYEIK